MWKIRVCRDHAQCRELWEQYRPQECLFDLWGVRLCFARHYEHVAEFHIACFNGSVVGMLPLSWIEETGRYGFFPGELWQGKTWLEQNKIVSIHPEAVRVLLENIARPAHLRYLSPAYPLPAAFCGGESLNRTVDETGYLFFPAGYDYAFDKFMPVFSPRSRKKLKRELNLLENRSLACRFGHYPDLTRLFDLNLRAFGEKSYFYDSRFLQSFETLAGWLQERGMLHITTVLIGGEIAAVDIGAVWNSTYTVLAGGTNPDFPGVAKIINFQHLKWACNQKMTLVDFLCGDFGWKSRFHLSPRPLYVIDLKP